MRGSGGGGWGRGWSAGRPVVEEREEEEEEQQQQQQQHLQQLSLMTQGGKKTKKKTQKGKKKKRKQEEAQDVGKAGEEGGEQRGETGELPVVREAARIVEAVRDHATTVVVGETGSGKSTQVPQILFQHLLEHAPGARQRQGRKMAKRQRMASAAAATPAAEERQWRGGEIVCTQPRRVAAVTVARRVAEEQRCAVGSTVGYSIRFENRTSEETRIRFVTDGVLLRECMSDRDLSRYSVIILDEAHERSLQTDVLMGLVKDLQRRRPDLRVVVMSATLDVAQFTSFFHDATSVIVPGRMHAVSVYYTREAQEAFVDSAVGTALQIHEEEDDGDVLIFLPGQEDIDATQRLLEQELPQSLSQRPAIVCPMYAALPHEKQMRVFEPTPHGSRKFVVATNIAETSITISGIRYVVDTGLCKVRSFRGTSATGMEALHVAPTSQAQAQQRAGRAGREHDGKCFRLYREQEFERMDPFTLPEIQRVNVAEVLLQLCAIGITRPTEFDFLTPPSEDAVHSAAHVLTALQAVTVRSAAAASPSSRAAGKAGTASGHKPKKAPGNGTTAGRGDSHAEQNDDGHGRRRARAWDMHLTPLGQRMAQLPLNPIHSKFLLESVRFGCTAEALTVVAMLSAENVFFRPSSEEDRVVADDHKRTFAMHEGDVPTLLRVFNAWVTARRDADWCRAHFLNVRSMQHAWDVRKQLSDLLTEQGIDVDATCGAEQEALLRCLVTSWTLNLARRVPVSQEEVRKAQQRLSSSFSSSTSVIPFRTPKYMYSTFADNLPVYVHPSSVLHGKAQLPECVAFNEILETSKLYMRGITAVQTAWLPELVPQLFQQSSAAAGAAQPATKPGKARTPTGNGASQLRHSKIGSSKAKRNQPKLKLSMAAGAQPAHGGRGGGVGGVRMSRIR